MTISNTRTFATASAIAAALAIGTIAAPATAGSPIVYAVSDYTGGDHGLWVNQLSSGANRFYSFQLGSTLTVDVDNDIATLVAIAKNPAGSTANLALTFTGFSENLMGTGQTYKKESGFNWSAAVDGTNDIDFFTDATGTFDIDGTVYSLAANPFAGGHAFQYGNGANAKSATDLGGSSWLNVDGQPAHWDINFNMTAVPEPSTWAMMLLGFFAIGAGMRRRETSVRYAF